jgi:hypothetical protein
MFKGEPEIDADDSCSGKKLTSRPISVPGTTEDED